MDSKKVEQGWDPSCACVLGLYYKSDLEKDWAAACKPCNSHFTDRRGSGYHCIVHCCPYERREGCQELAVVNPPPPLDPPHLKDEKQRRVKQ